MEFEYSEIYKGNYPLPNYLSWLNIIEQSIVKDWETLNVISYSMSKKVDCYLAWNLMFMDLLF